MNLSALNPFPTLETERLALGPLAATHAEPLLEILGDPEVTRYHDLETLKQPMEALAFIAEMMARHHNSTGLRWAVTERTTGRLVGTVGLKHFSAEEHRCVLGYEFRQSIWGQGYGTEAVRSVVQFGHQQLALNRIEALVMPENRASLALLAKLGFTDEGCLRSLGFWKGQFHDLQILSLLAADLQPSKPK